MVGCAERKGNIINHLRTFIRINHFLYEISVPQNAVLTAMPSFHRIQQIVRSRLQSI